MGSAFDYAATFENHNKLGSCHCGKAMGNDKGCAPGEKCLEGLADEGFTFGIEGTGGFVENEEVGLEENGTGDADALTLPTTEESTAVANGGVVGLGELKDEVVGLGNLSRLLDLLPSGMGSAVGDVVPDSIVEKECVLFNNTYVLPERGGTELLDGTAINEDLTR